ncbi:MAG: hypothetical protein K2X42_01460, partial [Burkholderiaceae bacterium]|nr:hypothetical protein [Burkholderiaceae bacterium]
MAFLVFFLGFYACCNREASETNGCGALLFCLERSCKNALFLSLAAARVLLRDHFVVKFHEILIFKEIHMALHPVVESVTARIIARSRPSRGA